MNRSSGRAYASHLKPCQCSAAITKAITLTNAVAQAHGSELELLQASLHHKHDHDACMLKQQLLDLSARD